MKHYLVVATGVIVIVVTALYGRSVGYGLVLDDFNHRAQLREGGWSFGSLVEAAHLGGPRRRVLMWWQEDADQHFFRPLAFLLMRVEYVIGGWRPAVMHVFSLAWLAVGGLLVMLLARAALGSAFWAGLAGVLFVMHPGNGMTPRWVACQNEQMASVFMLLGLLLYARWSGWQWRREARRQEGGWGWVLATVACFVAALGCRETGVMLVPLLVAGDGLLRPGRLKGRWGVYVLLVGVLAVYFAVRHLTLGGFPVPGRPYAYPPGEAGFARFVLDKFVYYVLGLFAFVPIVGFEGLRVLRAHPGVFYGTFAAIVAIWGTLVLWLRGRAVLWFWLTLAILPLLPVLPVFASSHHLYLASAGMVLAGVSIARWVVERASSRSGGPPPLEVGDAMIETYQSSCPPRLKTWATPSGTRPVRAAPGRKLVRVGVGAMIALHLAAFAGMNVAYDASLAGFSAASQLPVDDVARFGRPMKPGDKLFFINLPMLGWNCVPAIEEATGTAPLTGYALTFAPSLLRMDRPGCVERVGQRQLRVWMDDDGYFSGPIGQRLLEAAGRDRPFAIGETFRAPDFQVEVTAASEAGVRELLFTFVHPLDDPTYHFFLGSPVFSAYPWPVGEPVKPTAARDTS